MKNLRFDKPNYFQKGNKPWNTGIKRPEISGKKHWNWKGDEAGYSALHKWVQRKLGKAIKCSKCGSLENVEWANKSHKYLREITDWISLCFKCHRKYDKKYWGVASKIYGN